MEKFSVFMQEKIGPLAQRISSNRIIGAISDGFNMIMGVIIIGALVSLVNTINIGGYQNFLTSIGIKPYLNLVTIFTTNMLGLYASFFIAYAFANRSGITQHAISTGLFSLIAFLIITPLKEIEQVNYITFDFLGTQGIFTAIIIGLIVGCTFTVIVKNNITIKMPNGTPPMVSKSFAAIIPGFIVVIGAVLIALVVQNIFKCSLTELVYNTVSKPFSYLTGSIVTYIIFLLFISIFWLFGIHGGQIFAPFIIMLYMANGVANQEMFAAGQPMTNILTFGFYIVSLCGGNGATLGLSLDILLFSKSKRFKSLGKLSFVPSLCGINEPLIFGLPIVMNPILAIPFIVAPIVIALLTYFAMSMDIVSLTRIVSSPQGTPYLMEGYLMCGISGIVMQLVNLLVSALIYFPFFKAQDNIAYNEELSAATEE